MQADPDQPADVAVDPAPNEAVATDLPASLPIESAIPDVDPAMPNAVNPSAAVEDILANAGDAADAFSVSPLLMFFIGVGLLGMLLYYWSSESMRNRRIVGTVLTVLVAAASVFFFQNLGIKEGIELRGGIALTIQIQPAGEREVNEQAQDTAIAVMRKRLDAQGTSEVVIAKQGTDRVFVQIPGVQPEELPGIIETLSQVARLNFYIVAEDKDPSGFLAMQVAAGDEIVPGYKALPQQLEEGETQPSRYYLVPVSPDMPGKHVTKASARYGAQGYEINVSFDSDGAKIMGPLSKAHQQEPMAIVLDDEVISAPVIQAVLTDGCQITGRFDREEAVSLASSLENPLENEITILNQNYISPTMGKATVDQGKLAGIAGLVLTLIFIMVYYRFAGVIALVGLVINVGVIFGAMSLFKFTLTLPGIAGIILTIGIAIDASVLIYERLREEMQAGKSLPVAIKAAYDKAFSAIFDANITTLITAVILYIVASGTVKGFAVTLIIGILASLFSALLVTRVAFNWATDTGFLKKMTFMNVIPGKSIDFLSARRKFAGVSAVLIVISIIFVPLKDPRGVDLKGGSMITIESTDKLNQDSARDAIAGATLSVEPSIQTQHPIGQDAEYVTIRVGEKDAETVIGLLAEKTGADLSSAQVETVGSLIGNEMLRTSLLALGISLIAILIWVTFRFEFAFALGAIIALFHDLVIVLGLSTIFGLEISLITVGAFLTIAGYSINDTIVVFDRVREGLQTKRGEVKDIMNYCLNATLGRTLLTSLTTLTVVITLAVFGGPALRNFAMTLIIGVMVGTYSSIFIAAPIVLWWTRRTGTNLRREILDAEQAKIVGPAGTEA